MIEKMSEDRIRKRHGYAYSILCREKLENNKVKEIPPTLVKVIDISYSGIGLTSNKALNVDDTYILNFKVGERDKKVKFKVVWMNKLNDEGASYGFRLGCQFVEVTKDDVYFIHDIITNIKRN